MDTTDIQRYPDNYEVLSTDAALRAEKIACRLRHLIYSSTTIHKGDYLTSAGIVHGIEVVYEDGVLDVTLPGLLPKRKQRQNTEFLLDPFYFSLEQYAKEHPMPRFSDCVVCFTQVYDQCLPTRRIRDYDNLEEKQLLDVLSTFVMADDTGLLCDAYNTAALGEKDCTRISVMEKKRFPAWLAELHHGFLPKFLAVSVKATHHKEVITWEIPTARHDGVQASLSDCHLRRVPHRPA